MSVCKDAAEIFNRHLLYKVFCTLLRTLSPVLIHIKASVPVKILECVIINIQNQTVSAGCIRIPIPAQPPDSGCLSQSAPSMVSSSTAAFPALKL